MTFLIQPDYLMLLLTLSNNVMSLMTLSDCDVTHDTIILILPCDVTSDAIRLWCHSWHYHPWYRHVMSHLTLSDWHHSWHCHTLMSLLTLLDWGVTPWYCQTNVTADTVRLWCHYDITLNIVSTMRMSLFIVRLWDVTSIEISLMESCHTTLVTHFILHFACVSHMGVVEWKIYLSHKMFVYIDEQPCWAHRASQ